MLSNEWIGNSNTRSGQTGISDGLVRQATWAYSLYLLYLMLLRFPKSWLHHSLPYNVPSRLHWQFFIFLEDPLSDFAYVPGATRLDVCLLRQGMVHTRYAACCWFPMRLSSSNSLHIGDIHRTQKFSNHISIFLAYVGRSVLKSLN
jgi:hypothetical protein